MQHCFGHTQPMSVVFTVCTYRSKSQLGNLEIVVRVKGAKGPKLCVYHVATLFSSCRIALISLKYQVLARGKVLNARVLSCSQGPGISYLSPLSCKTVMPFLPSLCITHLSGCLLTTLTWICHFTTNSCGIPGLLPYNCFYTWKAVISWLKNLPLLFFWRLNIYCSDIR